MYKIYFVQKFVDNISTIVILKNSIVYTYINYNKTTSNKRMRWVNDTFLLSKSYGGKPALWYAKLLPTLQFHVRLTSTEMESLHRYVPKSLAPYLFDFNIEARYTC